MTRALAVLPVLGLPEIRPGDDLAALIGDALVPLRPEPRDVVVVAQKIVSKAEGRYRDLVRIEPGPRARELARLVDKDPRLVELILAESVEVVRARPGLLIVENRQGLVMANAGIDQSNLEPAAGEERVLLLPEDPDASARRLRDALETRFAAPLGVLVIDSIGRPWRQGTTGFAIGAAGLPPLWDRRGEADRSGRTLQATEVAQADGAAAAASLVMGEAAEGVPVTLLRGLDWTPAEAGARALLRPRALDLFR